MYIITFPILFLFTPSLAFFLPLAQEQDRPTLRLWDGRPVQWDTGPVAALLETSSAVRISYRGIHFYDHDVFPRSTGHPCARTPLALCILSHDLNLVLPSLVMPRYSTGANQAEPVRFAAVEGCGQASTERIVVSDPSVYDISSCDLENVDIVWSKGRVYIDSETRLPLWAYVASSLCVLFLVISLGQNIGSILGDPDAATQPWFTELACVLQCILVVILNDPMRIWVAEHDRLMLVMTIAYIALYLSRHGVALLVMQGHVYTLNVITATLMLVTSRLYCSFETPYATVFLLLLLTRLAHKLFSDSATGIERLTIVADALFIGLHYRLAYHPGFFDPQVRHTLFIPIAPLPLTKPPSPQAATVYLAALTASAFAAGALTHGIEERAKALPQVQDVGGRPGATTFGNDTHAITFRTHCGETGPNLRLQFLHA